MQHDPLILLSVPLFTSSPVEPAFNSTVLKDHTILPTDKKDALPIVTNTVLRGEELVAIKLWNGHTRWGRDLEGMKWDGWMQEVGPSG